MADAAIVIGINRYWKPGACLRGAVRDALRMREWLVAPDGAGVPARNVFLCLALRDDDPAPAVPFIEATFRNLLTLIQRDLLAAVGPGGGRLYFHYSGHGANARIDLADVNALLACDFDEQVTSNSISYASILEFFKAVPQFEEQFFFFDACRNTPWKDEFAVGRIARPRQIDAEKPPVQQYVCYATTPRLEAIELIDMEDERGAFTDALLEGLTQGAGAAKVWDATNEQYLVRWDQLYRQTRATVEKRKLAVGESGRRIQLPQNAGENFSQNPVLARIPPERVADSSLAVSVAVDRGEPPPAVIVEVDDLGKVRERHVLAAAAAVQMSVKPRHYLVEAEAKGFRPARKHVEVLDQPATVALELAVAPAGQVMGTGLKGLEGFRPAIVDARTSDPMARVELLDGTGATITSGLGGFEHEVPPGFYTARVRTPEGVEVDEPVFAAAGTNLVLLGAPPMTGAAVTRALVADARFTVRDDHTLDVAEVDGHVAAAQLSTLLTLAAHTANHGVPWGSRLHAFGLPSARARLGDDAGVEVLIGIDHADPAAAIERVRASRVAVFAQGAEPPPPSELTTPPDRHAFGAHVQAHAPGPCWVRVALGGRRRFDVATTVVPGRLTLLVVSESESGELAVFQYLPRLGPTSTEPHLLRSFELAQRAFQRGDLEAAAASLGPLHDSGWDDPLVTLVAAYLALKRGDLPGVADALAAHQRAYPDLVPDWRVLGTIIGSPAAGGAPGLPLFAEGLRRLDTDGTLPDPLPGFLWSVVDPRRGS